MPHRFGAPFDRLPLGAELDSELLLAGDAGTTEPSATPRRQGRAIKRRRLPITSYRSPIHTGIEWGLAHF